MARRLADVPLTARGAALLPAGALVVHQARYRLAFGAEAPQALAAQGHGYLSALVPWIALLAALALGATLGRLARLGRTPRAGAGPCTWLAATLALVAVYAGQELLEGLLAAGHPGGLAGVLGDGGWLALPLALAVGGLLALGLRAADAATLPDAPAAPRPPAPAAPLSLLLVEPFVRRARPLARAAAGRAPPRAA